MESNRLILLRNCRSRPSVASAPALAAASTRLEVHAAGQGICEEVVVLDEHGTAPGAHWFAKTQKQTQHVPRTGGSGPVLGWLYA